MRKARLKPSDEIEPRKDTRGEVSTQLACRKNEARSSGRKRHRRRFGMTDCSRRGRASYDKTHTHRLKGSADKSVVTVVMCIIKQQWFQRQSCRLHHPQAVRSNASSWTIPRIPLVMSTLHTECVGSDASVETQQKFASLGSWSRVPTRRRLPATCNPLFEYPVVVYP